VPAPPLERRFPNISPKAYEHPADRAATAALASIPFLDTVVRRLTEFQYERALRQLYLGNAVRIGPDQLPDLWASHLDVVEVLDLADPHQLYMARGVWANALTIGTKEPMVVVDSALVSLLDQEQLRAVLAHEAAHVLSDHLLYRTALEIILSLSRLDRLPFVAGLPIIAIRSALLEWARATELSCDRAAALAVDDPRLVCRVLMTLAAGGEAEALDLDAFMAQAAEYEDWDSPFDRARRFFVEVGITHAFPVRRVSELMRWVQSGDWDRVRGGDYPTRDEPVDARGEAGDAVVFYAERFRGFFQDAGESVQAAGQQLADWLRGGGGPRPS
jgi:Zn-dependent protease with chaperone function